MSRTIATIEAINRLSVHPFAWGTLDCCRFGAEVARAVTGRDFMAQFAYSTPREAVQLINAAGGLRDLITHELGVEPRGVLQLLDGDPVLCELANGPTVGVRLGERVVCKTATGVGWLAVLDPAALCGWSLEDACRKR